MKIEILEGGKFEDERGILSFVNDFNFSEVKRFYSIEHIDTSIVRAWQGHQFEKKWFYVVSGTFCIAWVKIDNWENPDPNLPVNHIIVKESDNKLICVPNGYANGLKAIDKHSKIIVFSNMSLEESSNERIRYPENYWFDWSKIAQD